MINRKLNIDFSPLWTNPNQIFTLRYQDMNEPCKLLLAKRIKETAKQQRIKKTTGPSIQDIYETLTELNIIIFTENQCNDGTYTPRNSYRNFNFSSIKTISGYQFHNLCQAIYFILCIKREKTTKEITDITKLIHQNRGIVRNFVDTYFRTRNQEEQRNTPPEELGLEDIERARNTAIENGAGRNMTQNETSRISENQIREIYPPSGLTSNYPTDR